MPLLGHFHPPLHGPRRWEGFHHAWATFVALYLNQDVLPAEYFAESEITLGPEMEIDVATLEDSRGAGTLATLNRPTRTWSSSRPKFSVDADFSRLESYEIRVFQDLDGPQLRAAVDLISPANKDRIGTRQTFAAKCAGYLRNGIGLVLIDVVTSRSANLHRELFEMLEITGQPADWKAPSGLYAVAYRPVTLLNKSRIEVWPEPLKLGRSLPVLPLWLTLDLSVPLDLEASYSGTCRALRIPA